ncbi:hypothetical protein [Polyangium jinanense]|uniref:Lipoprotein n=1 Tax=Polyangium jinanense TaxID=2829994 RepID=A0A9X4AYI4_9BACT|nr:hypothetical protein [Polyangium jinanense]MDC3962159.1 hypothetical protein [Polyangium jinanense]MDC3988836.1 hypothetical protein [Polyangium jinanense]
MGRRLVRSMAALGLGALVLAGCDRTSRVHVEGRIQLPAHTDAALVVPLEGAKGAFSVDTSGRFVGTYGALHVHPDHIPLLVHVPSHRPVVLVPGRDFRIEEQDGSFHAAIDLDPARARLPRPLALACTTESCTADLPVEAKACVSTVVVLDGTKTTLVTPGTQRREDGGTRLLAFFPLPRQRSRSLVVVSTCGDEAYVSEVATFDGP